MSAISVVDDLGYAAELPHAPRRVVSLVPSITEALAATCPELLVGATDWCTHPAELDVARVRGTKNPNLDAIQALEPDLVVVNKEENRELDVRRMRERGIAVYVTDIVTVPGSLDSLERVFGVLGVRGGDRPQWLHQAREEWGGPIPEPTLEVAVAIWRDPWMVVGSDTFTGDLMARLGWRNVFDRGVDADGGGRYPAVDLAELDRARDAGGAEVVLLPDEPYVFTAEDGPEAFSATRTALVSGRLLTWYGPSLVGAKERLAEAVR